MCLESTGMPSVIILMILRDSILHFAYTTSFLMKVIDPPDNLDAV